MHAALYDLEISSTVVVCYRELQCVTVSCNVLQWVAV